MVVTGRPGRQLSTLLHALGAGRRALPPLPPLPPPVAGDVGAVRRVVALFGADRPVQADPTTCGSAALVMLAAAGDPRVARWLATGEAEPGASTAPELGWLDQTVLDGAHQATPTTRFGALQQAVKVRSNRRALLGLSWPSGLGTPPWGAQRVARFGAVRYAHRLLVDTSPGQSGPLLDHAIASARRGLPVPFYTGGDTRGGLGAAVPRHVVVLTSPDGVALEVYEPSVGRMLAITPDELAQGGSSRPAYGNWSHVTWVLLPVAPDRSPPPG
ncbi:hypothetical protein SAMN05216410_1895 [Sanguibacter gelidistatuariae]|uniref:Peptidase_C39 like family protein n=1 Tax=Sanguibacter gelidistatuariae TaxID=1814289 RepID=A0A1G6MJE3_9MICO|nr:hypothetical protein SAMN05216410_1895 [Sanguibacter gelidistatuariae]